MVEQVIPEPFARRIMEQAIREGCCADVLNCLFAGGSVTLDYDSGRVRLATAEELAAMWSDD